MLILTSWGENVLIWGHDIFTQLLVYQDMFEDIQTSVANEDKQWEDIWVSGGQNKKINAELMVFYLLKQLWNNNCTETEIFTCDH